MGTAVFIQQARIAIREGRPTDARRLLRQAIHEEPQNHVAWLLLARATPDKKLAGEYVNRAHLLQPESPLVQRALAGLEPLGEKRSRKNLFNWRVATALAALAMLIGLMAAGLSQGIWDQVLAQQDTNTESIAMAPAAPLPARIEPVSQVVAPGEPAAIQPAATAVSQELQPDSLQVEAEAQSSSESVDLAAPEAPDKAAEAPASPDLSIPEAIQNGLETQSSTGREEESLATTAESAAGGENAAEETAVEEPEDTAVAEAPVEAEESAPSDLKPGLTPGERWIDVNLTTQTLVAYEGDTPVLTSLISSGMWQFPTVTGQFRTWLKYDTQDMSGYHLGYNYDLEDVPYVMYFYKDFAIHGAYWHNNFGTPMSHGCVNMNTMDAGWLYEWAPIGTLVNVHY
jgi:lipoprotein-anchoring transpeptidase ErfK/SrfK